MQNNLNKTFYFNYKDNEELSYSDVLNYVANAEKVAVNYSFNSTKDFLLNFITSLYYNKDITLQDLNKHIESNASISLEKVESPKNILELIKGVKKSFSKITLFTSGTTGQPKEITHSVSNLTREVRIGEKFQENIWGFAYNPTHMAGLQVFFQAFFNLNSLYDVFELSKKEVIEVLNNYKLTNISATPTFYRLLVPLKEPILSLKNISLGGEKSENNLHQKIKVSFPKAKVLNIYASTEVGTLFSTSGRYFKILPAKEDIVKIVDGELWIHRELLGERKGNNENGLWYKTGDLVEIINKEKKEFRFVSRKNEMINVGGNKVNPLEIEFILDELEGVEKSYVFGKPNPILGNMLYAKVQLNDLAITEIKLKQALRKKLENFQIPRKIEFVESLELTRSGKLKRNL